MKTLTKTIKVMGIGGAGINVLNSLNLTSASNIGYLAIDTSKPLGRSRMNRKIQIGVTGTDGNPTVGQVMAEQSKELIDALQNVSDIVLFCGTGGGCGSGVSPVVAKLAKQMGIKVYAVVTFPFQHEGPVRFLQATQAVAKLQEYADSVKVILNESINLKIKDDLTTPLTTAFGLIDKEMQLEIDSLIEFVSNNA